MSMKLKKGVGYSFEFARIWEKIEEENASL